MAAWTDGDSQVSGGWVSPGVVVFSHGDGNRRRTVTSLLVRLIPGEVRELAC
jgi:hypothetical protein